ncbi:MAG: UvrB/UvrC motif-containing protein [Candidatus Brocadiae bacterium]|nr:UvrB/UvrC motif-containing protein [Candidatus Brocadiia bacterium]
MAEDETICGECGKRRATWHLTDFVGGQAVQQHLCEQCYRKKEGGSADAEAAFARLIAAMVPELKEMATRECPACGISYLEFRQSMRLGCPNDYEAFNKPLEELLQRIHGGARHNGKVPLTADREAGVRSRISSLRRQQKKAVAEENYELAGELRDRIRKLQEHEPDAPEG